MVADAELLDLACRRMAEGVALMWVVSYTNGMWSPGWRLSDFLKTQPADRVRKIAAELRLAGVHDLDELLDEPGEGIPGDFPDGSR